MKTSQANKEIYTYINISISMASIGIQKVKKKMGNQANTQKYTKQVDRCTSKGEKKTQNKSKINHQS